MSDEMKADEPFPQPGRKPGGEPCGECHLSPGETCDICGAVSPKKTKVRYTRWSQPFEAALARGHDHGSAAYIADQWEAKHVHLTGGTGIIRNAADAAKRR